MSTEGELTSWKEIAEHLGVNVRTAQKWESELALPVRRMPGARGRVSADRAELDAWRQRTRLKPSWWDSPRFLQRYALVSTLVAAVAAGWGVAERIEVWRPQAPATLQVERTALVAHNSKGRELWRYHFAFPMTLYEPIGNSGLHFSWIGDLDGDGKTEVLFVYHSSEHLEDALLCLDAKGQLRWRYVPGSEVKTHKDRFKPPFSIRDFTVVSGLAGKRWVALSASHPIYYPGAIFLLDARGRSVGEYRHFGIFGRVNTADMDGDGVGEIYATGTNAAEKSATMVVLDPRRMRGVTAARETDQDYQIQGDPPAAERARVLFPRSRLNRTLQSYSTVRRIYLNPTSILVDVLEQWDATDRAATIYEFTPDLRLEHFELTDGFRSYHAEMTAAKVLRYPLSEEERLPERLRVTRNTPGAIPAPSPALDGRQPAAAVPQKELPGGRRIASSAPVAAQPVQ
ncbi:MAG: hypothetical protein ACKV22_33165 [Bryobacteraceae bacterium]